MILNEEFDFTLDWYNVGALIFECLILLPPFNMELISRAVSSENLYIPSYIDPIAADLIRSLMSSNV